MPEPINYDEIIERLTQKTEEGKVGWAQVYSLSKFTCTVDGEFTFSIEKYQPFGREGTFVRLSMTDKENNEIFQVEQDIDSALHQSSQGLGDNFSHFCDPRKTRSYWTVLDRELLRSFGELRQLFKCSALREQEHSERKYPLWLKRAHGAFGIGHSCNRHQPAPTKSHEMCAGNASSQMTAQVLRAAG